MKLQKPLEPTRAVFLDIDHCRTQLPQSTARRYFTEAEESLIEGLLIGWNKSYSRQTPEPGYVPLQIALTDSHRFGFSADAPLTPAPDTYLNNLKNDAAVCQAALPNLKNSPQAQEAVLGVIRDLNIKFRDCYTNGMGRLIPVEVVTKKGPQPESGWTVYFKWVTVSNLPTTETPFRTSSTPARDQLPPGVYQLRAEKKDPQSASALTSETKTVNLTGDNNKCELQVP